MIAIIDYDAGNTRSVINAFRYLGVETVLTADPGEILAADGAVLPGVGAFGDAMDRLKAGGLDETIREFVKTGKPFLGICLGLQVLFERSDESPEETGLGILPGEILRIPASEGCKVPQIGWNSVTFPRESRIFAGIPEGAYMYFVHSYYLKAHSEEDVAARTFYSVQIDAAVERENVFACQFHPEKSGETGLMVLRNFARLCGDQRGNNADKKNNSLP
ncbi:MAG: imidazole glycerol phosphate synthase subunit HisH [Lachnospiraceae bacterium]|nr:imidazole glycerol phosphate synthase subunit HisH [Lachnospiraceae bacterium]